MPDCQTTVRFLTSAYNEHLVLKEKCKQLSISAKARHMSQLSLDDSFHEDTEVGLQMEINELKEEVRKLKKQYLDQSKNLKDANDELVEHEKTIALQQNDLKKVDEIKKELKNVQTFLEDEKQRVIRLRNESAAEKAKRMSFLAT